MSWAMAIEASLTGILSVVIECVVTDQFGRCIGSGMRSGCGSLIGARVGATLLMLPFCVTTGFKPKPMTLKKAYAEIIQNTVKEAADRAMAGESKALRFHHDLRNIKDEALRMLLRFKQMIDVKTGCIGVS